MVSGSDTPVVKIQSLKLSKLSSPGEIGPPLARLAWQCPCRTMFLRVSQTIAAMRPSGGPKRPYRSEAALQGKVNRTSFWYLRGVAPLGVSHEIGSQIAR